ncbi:hypothetical protein FOA43_000376 [Brettanomyces nanus]|uniref:J domain-containing protein n=1 Tax=Eeniella nana TaxID=13502 RepID=A0A875RVP9_EENNA|nr:uncharacterized protein FOA43_000376 [Brettanomyces nanus]QPG73071.1 hypothetical protein FOA43_000376 [Brettanomyces nanus]
MGKSVQYVVALNRLLNMSRYTKTVIWTQKLVKKTSDGEYAYRQRKESRLCEQGSYQHRYYATPVDGQPNEQQPHPSTDNPELIELLHSYPVEHGSSPYVVMGFKSEREFQLGSLKKRFHQLAKIYHPDSSAFDGCSLSKHKFFTTNGERKSEESKLTDPVKEKRFKRILSAYTLLRNPLMRSNYDNYQIGWEDNSQLLHRSPDPNFHSPNSAFYQHMHHQRYNSHGNTGTWEDYWDTRGATYGFQGDKTWQAEGETFYEQFYNNRKNIFISMTLFVAAYAALQATHLYLFEDYIGQNSSETFASEELQEKSEKDLADAHINFGLGLTKDDRINRFLWFRKISTLLSLGDLNEIMEHLRDQRLLIRDEETGRVRMREYHNEKLAKQRRQKVARDNADVARPIDAK